MTNDEVMHHIRNDTPLNKVRAVLSGIIGSAEQAGMQRRCPSPIEMRAAEFKAVGRLLDAAIAQGLVAPAAQADAVLRSADEWIASPEFRGITIMDPDGWDRTPGAFEASWAERITLEEMWRRTNTSTCIVDRAAQADAGTDEGEGRP